MKLVYFAWVREHLGLDSETIELPDDVTSAGELAAWLRTRGGAYETVFGELARVRIAVDQAMADVDTSVVGAREVAFFPPVTGG